MKSYVNSLADYKQAEFEKEATVSCPEKFVEAQMKHLTRAFKKTEAVNVIEKGDVTVLALESELEKFNRPAVFVTVGGGLFDKGFEEQLIGHKTGETFEAAAEGKPVKVSVKQITRTIFPEPTDEMAAAYAKEHDDFSEIKTVSEYRKKIVEKYIEDEKNKILYDAMDGIMDYVLTHSDWEFDEEEVEETVKQEYEYINEQLKEEGKTFEELTEEDLKAMFGVKDRSELDDMLKSGCERQIAAAIWIAVCNGLDPKTVSDEEIDKCSWEFLENYVKENINIKEEN